MAKLRRRPAWRRALPVLAAGATLVVTAACSSSTSSGSSSAGSGNSGSPIKIGLITSLSGALAPQFAGVNSDFKARIDVANAAGGIDGRKIEVFIADDAGSVQGNLSRPRAWISVRRSSSPARCGPWLTVRTWRYSWWNTTST